MKSFKKLPIFVAATNIFSMIVMVFTRMKNQYIKIQIS